MVIKLHPQFVLRMEKNVAYGIGSDNQLRVKIADDKERFWLYLASLSKYEWKFPLKDNWIANQIIGVDKLRASEYLNPEKEQKNFLRILSKKPENYAEYPLMVTVGLTNQCPFFCNHCGNNSGPRAKTSLPLQTIQKIIDECSSMKVLKMTFTGGEPMARKDIFEIAAYAKKRIPRVSITSNGIFINKETARKLADISVSMVKISLDGLKQFHDANRNFPGAFDNAVNAIKNLKSFGIETRVQATLMKQNRRDILKLTDLVNNLGVNMLTVVPLSPIGRASLNDMLTPLEYRGFIQQFIDKVSAIQSKTVYQIRPIFDFNLKINLPTLSMKYKCEALINSLEIKPDGAVIPCSFFNLSLGNIYKDKIANIWKSPKANEARAYFNPENLKGRCENCIKKPFCAGGCLANSYALSGKTNLRDVYCWKQ